MPWAIVKSSVAATGPSRGWRNARKKASSKIIAETTIAILYATGSPTIHGTIGEIFGEAAPLGPNTEISPWTASMTATAAAHAKAAIGKPAAVAVMLAVQGLISVFGPSG